MVIELRLLEKGHKMVYEGFDNQTDLNKRILKIILDGKSTSIYYKGDPFGIHYKLLKRILLGGYSHEVKCEPSKIKKIYKKVVEKQNNSFCLIYII